MEDPATPAPWSKDSRLPGWGWLSAAAPPLLSLSGGRVGRARAQPGPQCCPPAHCTGAAGCRPARTAALESPGLNKEAAPQCPAPQQTKFVFSETVAHTRMISGSHDQCTCILMYIRIYLHIYNSELQPIPTLRCGETTSTAQEPH